MNKYNNTYRKTTKMKPSDVNWSMYIDFNRENNNNYISYNNNNNHSWLIEYKNIKIFLQKITVKIGLKKFKKV